MTAKQNRDAGITPIEMATTKSLLILKNNDEQIDRAVSLVLNNSENKNFKNGKSIEKVCSIPPKTTTNILTTLCNAELITNKIKKQKPHLLKNKNNLEEERGRRKIVTTINKTFLGTTQKT